MITSLNPNDARRPNKGVIKVTLANFGYTGTLLFRFRHHNLPPAFAMQQILDEDEIFDKIEEDFRPGGTAELEIVDRENSFLRIVLHDIGGDTGTIELDLEEDAEAFSRMIIGMEVVSFEKA